MENIAPIQIAEPKREKRAAVTAAYRRGYADALEDMRKRQYVLIMPCFLMNWNIRRRA